MSVCFYLSKYLCLNMNNGYLILVYGIENKRKIIDSIIGWEMIVR